MAKAKKTAAVVAESSIADVAVMSEDSGIAVMANVPDTQKHVSLAQLYIIKEYIDKQVNKTVSSVDGIHGIRYYNGKLQAKDASTRNWIDIATGNTDEGGSGGVDIADDKDVENLFS